MMASLRLNSLPSHISTNLSSSSSSSSRCFCFHPYVSSITTNGTPLKPIIVTGDPPTYVSAPGRRIVAVGDLHGDIDKARQALQIAGVLSGDDEHLWTGGNAVLIQLGDVLDRGEDEIAILSLLRWLDIQAKSVGGAVFQINGNHETMNVEGDFRYVHGGAYDECVDFLSFLEINHYEWESAFVKWIGASQSYKRARNVSGTRFEPWNLVKKQKGVVARSMLLKQGGLLANEMAKHGVSVIVNDVVFCHGGVLPHHVAYGLDRMNAEVSRWMRGVDGEYPFTATRGYDSVVWSRLYSRDASELTRLQSDKIKLVVEETLAMVGAKRMVVGHTPQLGGANCEHDCRVWRIDVGMSRGVLNSGPEVLEIIGDKVRVLTGEKDVPFMDYI